MPVLLIVAALLALFGAGEARAETRTLKLYFVHTKERAEITYKRNGRYIKGGLDQLNRFLRDWRRNEPTRMDPHLMDILWEAYRASGSRDYIHVISAYRSPTTNAMLRKRSSGVAKTSQHMLGKAIDFYIPDVKLSKLRAIGLKMQGGGVGYYPRSGSPFVHMDVGNVRHWPRMSRRELAAVFPNGKTLHVPTDGKPLPGYDQALAAYKARQRSGATVQLASAARSRPGGFLSALFGGGADEEEDSNVTVASAASRDAGSASASASRPAQRQTPAQAQQPQQAERAPAPPQAPAAAPEAPAAETPETILASLPADAVPLPLAAPRVQATQEEVDQIVTAFAAPAGETVEVPLPIRRPEARELPVDPTLAVAAQRAEERPVAVPIPNDNARPDEASDGAAAQSPVELAALAPVPGLRPGTAVEAASLIPSQLRDPVAEGPRAADGADSDTDKGSRVALAPVARSKPGPGSALDTGVQTTAKAARPRAADGKPDPKPVVIPVERIAARWAMEAASRSIRSVAASPTPSLAYNAIRTAPKQVYTTGFRKDKADIDPARFSGNAVTFMSVARFTEN
ncbi:DUF882 domain-containing protein [Mesorhizobium xinjiangense]|uniref:DUF882 domain-containing protein n=1 Tax=Mesorhizobium xinjiangense TaxID=2678685 RepID=UPI001F2246E3|nr:DUF882 domain-containing protein [Mesorhizobium xinjiangense]